MHYMLDQVQLVVSHTISYKPESQLTQWWSHTLTTISSSSLQAMSPETANSRTSDQPGSSCPSAAAVPFSSSPILTFTCNKEAQSVELRQSRCCVRSGRPIAAHFDYERAKEGVARPPQIPSGRTVVDKGQQRGDNAVQAFRLSCHPTNAATNDRRPD